MREFKWDKKTIEKITRYLKSKKGISETKRISDKLSKLSDEYEQNKRDEIAWWHKIKDEPFTI